VIDRAQMIKFTRQSIFQHILEIPPQQSACSAKFSGIRRRRPRDILVTIFFGDAADNRRVEPRVNSASRAWSDQLRSY
jgi:hypothetical protein